MIQVRSLTRRFGSKTVLHRLNFEAKAGEFVALLGPNGAGKTTFLRILASLTRPDAGDVVVAGCRLPAQAQDLRRRVGFVSHQPLLYGDLTAAENLAFFGRLYGIDRLESRVEEVLELVGMRARRCDAVRSLSRGMQQRLAIGRAVLHRPVVLLFDEPYTGLDPEAFARLDALLRTVSAQGFTVLMTSHDLAHAAGLAGRIDVLAGGGVRASAPSAGLQGAGLLDFYTRAVQP